MKKLLKRIQQHDPQIVLHFDPERERWVVLRVAEKYGRPDKQEYTHGEVIRRRSNGYLLEILVCQNDAGYPIEPSDWIIDYLREKDTRRLNFRQYVREMDDRNQKRSEQMEADRKDRFNYRVKEDWNHIRDELRGETRFGKYTIPVEKPLNEQPSDTKK